MNIPAYPRTLPIALEMRDHVHALLAPLESGISEQTFANLYLFRETYDYHLTLLPDATLAIHGKEQRGIFWIFPQALPSADMLAELSAQGQFIKCIPERDRAAAESYAQERGYRLVADRDNFDYLYLRSDLAELAGRKYHKKRNLIHNFEHNYRHRIVPLGKNELPDAHRILDAWHELHQEHNDYRAAREALAHIERLQLCGSIVYSGETPIAFALGEGMARHSMHVIHFEKAITTYRGIYQYLNKAYAALLPRHYHYINREQDMGDEGMRQAKMTYRPIRFVEKYCLFFDSL